MKALGTDNKFGTFCDWGIIFSLCVLIFVLPASIAYLDSFAALAIFFYLLKKISRWKGLIPSANVLNRPLQFLILAVFISVVFSQYPRLSLFAFFGKFLKSVFLYFAFIEAFSNQKRIRIFLIFFLASALLAALSGVWQHYTGIDFIKGYFFGHKNPVLGGRINSTFSDANAFGAYLLPVIGLVIHFLFTSIARQKSWFWAGAWAFFLGLLLACLCWTYSRSSWIGFLVILFVMVLLDRRKRLFVGTLLFVFIIIFLPSLNNVRHMGLMSNGGFQREIGALYVLEHGEWERNFLWKKAISIIRSSPIHGTGLNTYSRIIMRDPNRRTWWYAHNCYLQWAAETGLLGLACFLWMLFVLLRHGFDYCQRIKELWPLTILQGSVSGLSGFLVQSSFDNTFFTVQLGVLMWLIFGLIVAATRSDF